jgi:hypothetical protein
MKKYPFRFVLKQGISGVVEVKRDGNIDRCILPMDIIMEAKTELSEAQINAGIPYGIPFAEFLNIEAEIVLHNAGIFIMEDLFTKANAAVGALNTVGLKLTYVIKAVKEYQIDNHIKKVVNNRKNKEK